MLTTQPVRSAPPAIRVRKARAAGVLAAVAASVVAIAAVASHRSAELPSTSPVGAPGVRGPALLGIAGGAVPDGTTVFDRHVPAVVRLEPALIASLRQAATDAAGENVALVVNGGWRSAAYEDQLRSEAIVRYGSEAAAARWVATGSTSPHVSGHAVDVGPAAAAAWLSQHGARYGLCQIYANEPWHYELRPQAAGGACPAMYADPTHDPRTSPSRGGTE